MKTFLLLVALFTVAHGLAINKRQAEQVEEVEPQLLADPVPLEETPEILIESPEQSPDGIGSSDFGLTDDELKSDTFISLMQQFDSEAADAGLFDQILSYLDTKKSYKQ